MEKSNAYFRFFNETDLNDDGKLYFTCDYKFIENDKLWSYSESQKNMVSSLKGYIEDSDYVLCPLYGNIKDDLFSDLQFGVTETYKIRETDDNAFIRSIGEELGLHTFKKPDYMRHTLDSRYVFNKINIINTKPNRTSKFMCKYIKEDRRRKMATIVHGTETEICKFLNRPSILLDKSPDTIVGIVGVRFKDAQNYFNKDWKSIPKTLRSYKRKNYF